MSTNDTPRRTPYLSQEELLRLDSCWASSRIFSMSPLWMEDEDGTCSSPPAMTSSSSTWGRGSRPGAWASEGANAAAALFISNSTQEPVGGDGRRERISVRLMKQSD